jgi:hypothetical protein
MSRCKAVLSLVLAVGIGALIATGVTSTYAATGSKTVAAGPKGEAISGQVDSVNVVGKVLTIKDKGKEIQVVWTDTTKLAWKVGKEKPEPATVADLKAGEHVSVRGEKIADGKYTATSIWIHKAMEHPAKETKPQPAK